MSSVSILLPKGKLESAENYLAEEVTSWSNQPTISSVEGVNAGGKGFNLKRLKSVTDFQSYIEPPDFNIGNWTHTWYETLTGRFPGTSDLIHEVVMQNQPVIKDILEHSTFDADYFFDPVFDDFWGFTLSRILLCNKLRDKPGFGLLDYVWSDRNALSTFAYNVFNEKYDNETCFNDALAVYSFLVSRYLIPISTRTILITSAKGVGSRDLRPDDDKQFQKLMGKEEGVYRFILDHRNQFQFAGRILHVEVPHIEPLGGWEYCLDNEVIFRVGMASYLMDVPEKIIARLSKITPDRFGIVHTTGDFAVIKMDDQSYRIQERVAEWGDIDRKDYWTIE